MKRLLMASATAAAIMFSGQAFAEGVAVRSTLRSVKRLSSTS